MDWSDRRVALRRRRPDPTSPDPVDRLDSGSFRPAGSGVVLSNLFAEEDIGCAA
jgi:hypothetical protein